MSVEIYATLGEPHEIAATLSALRYLVFQGLKGDTGDSAYEEAVSLGFVGTEAEWIASLKGEKGDAGYSPEIRVTDITGGHKVDIYNELGFESFDVMDGIDGADGEDGTDGVSPTVAVTEIDGGHRVTITDADGAHTFDVMDGEDGEGGGSAANAVLYTAQSLTDAQKAQARTNVGAGTYSKPSGGIPDSDIASAATWNAKGTYSKPSGGIPASDLASGVIPTVPQMATQTDMSDWTSGKTVDAATLKTDFQAALMSLGDKANASSVYTKTEIDNKGYQTSAQVQSAIAAIPDELPTVTAADNGKVLGVVNGAWAVKSDEGGSTVTVDDALSTTSENPVQNKVVKAALDAKADKTTLLNLLIPILRQGLYGADQEAAISALETALGGTPPVQTFFITNNLTNVTNSNEATAVNSGAAYSATLTALSGMEMQTVTVTMGGVDVTSTVYSNGTISIASVTGNIVITAVAESLIETYNATLTSGFVGTNGAVNSSTSYNYTQHIPVQQGDKVYGTIFDTSTSSAQEKLTTRFTCAFNANDVAVPEAGNGSSISYKVDSPLVVPAGVSSYVFSLLTRYTDVVIYVDKSERVGA